MTVKNRFGMSGKSVLITGASQGLGLDIVQDLGREEMHVLIADIQTEKGEKAAEDIRNAGGHSEFFYVDLSSVDSVSSMIDQVERKYPKLDLLINNARSKPVSSPEELSVKDWELSMKVSLSGAFYCSRKVIPIMAKAGKGNIINISSTSATRIGSMSADYNVVKAGMNHLTRHLAFWEGPKGIRVNSISPAFIVKKTNISRYENDKPWKKRWEWCHPLKRAAYSEDLSNAILFLASDLASFITGQDLVVDGGLSLADSACLVNQYAEEFQ
jgi:NAD(P)-dependent dehydrogenase (short-subunit alcohol dehydrogenase family)